MIQPGFRLADLNGRTSSEIVASLVPGARVVKVANTLVSALLAADPRQAGGRRVLFMSGDDATAKAGVKGNSHMMMMDTNSDQVAALIQQWIEKQGLMQ